jgi:hypothetical protein
MSEIEVTMLGALGRDTRRHVIKSKRELRRMNATKCEAAAPCRHNDQPTKGN